MIEQDTIRLLRECDAGIKMGVGSIDEVLGQVRGGELRQCLIKCRNEHEKLANEIQTLLAKYHDKGKEPSPVAKGMSWIKTNAKMGMDDSDQTVANLMTDGCNMGVKSLHRYCNRYPVATADVRQLVNQLIQEEQRLSRDLQSYL